MTARRVIERFTCGLPGSQDRDGFVTDGQVLIYKGTRIAHWGPEGLEPTAIPVPLTQCRPVKAALGLLFGD